MSTHLPGGADNDPGMLRHDDEAVIKTMEFYQAIITRMASNSAACKHWSIPLVSAVVALMINQAKPELIWLTLPVILVFYLLDAYYLCLENQFRAAYNENATLIAARQFPLSRVYVIKPGGNFWPLMRKALASPSTWPVYVGMAAIVAVTYCQAN